MNMSKHWTVTLSHSGTCLPRTNKHNDAEVSNPQRKVPSENLVTFLIFKPLSKSSNENESLRVKRAPVPSSESVPVPYLCMYQDEDDGSGAGQFTNREFCRSRLEGSIPNERMDGGEKLD